MTTSSWEKKYPGEYLAWRAMRRRCMDKKHKDYPNYGGRGIKVCPEWQVSMALFFRDMGQKPTPEHSIEREDVDKDYEPNNCRWATAEEQANNRRNNLLVLIDGESLTAAEVARKFGIKPHTVVNRVRLAPTGTVFSKEFFTENRVDKLIFTYNGKTQSLKLWAEELGFPYDSLLYRVNADWTVEDIFTVPFRKRKPIKET